MFRLRSRQVAHVAQRVATQLRAAPASGAPVTAFASFGALDSVVRGARARETSREARGLSVASERHPHAKSLCITRCLRRLACPCHTGLVEWRARASGLGFGAALVWMQEELSAVIWIALAGFATGDHAPASVGPTSCRWPTCPQPATRIVRASGCGSSSYPSVCTDTGPGLACDAVLCGVCGVAAQGGGVWRQWVRRESCVPGAAEPQLHRCERESLGAAHLTRVGPLVARRTVGQGGRL
jgi:hypothetical protein